MAEIECTCIYRTGHYLDGSDGDTERVSDRDCPIHGCKPPAPLEASKFKAGTIKEFLNLSDEEEAEVERRVKDHQEASEAPALRESRPEEIARDRIWCEALAKTLLADDILRVTSKFNQLRPDKSFGSLMAKEPPAPEADMGPTIGEVFADNIALTERVANWRGLCEEMAKALDFSNVTLRLALNAFEKNHAIDWGQLDEAITDNNAALASFEKMTGKKP